jgi:NAD(P)-dependent dehydrogenase (short-subunit alcohol dehydrogenase family)
MVNTSRLSNKVAIVTGASKGIALELRRPWELRARAWL